MDENHRLHICCHGIEQRKYLFENLILIIPERGEMDLTIVLCDEIPFDLIKYFRFVFSHLPTNEFSSSTTYQISVCIKTLGDHKNISIFRLSTKNQIIQSCQVLLVL